MAGGIIAELLTGLQGKFCAPRILQLPENTARWRAAGVRWLVPEMNHYPCNPLGTPRVEGSFFGLLQPAQQRHCAELTRY
jgi:hypothetical protein